jgi:hypothetical protein
VHRVRRRGIESRSPLPGETALEVLAEEMKLISFPPQAWVLHVLAFGVKIQYRLVHHSLVGALEVLGTGESQVQQSP